MTASVCDLLVLQLDVGQRAEVLRAYAREISCASMSLRDLPHAAVIRLAMDAAAGADVRIRAGEDAREAMGFSVRRGLHWLRLQIQRWQLSEGSGND